MASFFPTAEQKKKIEDDLWLEQYEKLKGATLEGQQQGGEGKKECAGEDVSTKILSKQIANDKTFANWIRLQRTCLEKGMMRQDRRVLLKQIGFVANSSTEAGDGTSTRQEPAAGNKRWMTSYDKLRAYKAQHGDTLVPSLYSQDISLGYWCNTQRKEQKRGKLQKDRRDLLDAIGFTWDAAALSIEQLATVQTSSEQKAVDDAKWLQQYEKLKAYKKANDGDMEVPTTHEDREFADWVRLQRACLEKGMMRKDRKELLHEIGLVLVNKSSAAADKCWTKNYEKLVAYKEEHGDCLVPLGYHDKSLAMWINNQRTTLKAGGLRQDRKELLNKIGFAWIARRSQQATSEAKWMDNYEKLKMYMAENGGEVPHVFPNDVPLSTWVDNQRYSYRNGTMRQDRAKLLSEVGFVWEGPGKISRRAGPASYQKAKDQANWMDQYEKLKAYKALHGDTMVPEKYETDQALADWVRLQRTCLQKGIMRKERKELLNQIGFE